MSSILPNIEGLYQVPAIHRMYAETLLKLTIEKLLQMESFEIGTYEHGRDTGSIIGFDDDDFENVRLELKYNGVEFCVVVTDNTEDFDSSHFTYRVFEDSSTYLMIPEKLKEAMMSVADEIEPITFTP